VWTRRFRALTSTVDIQTPASELEAPLLAITGSYPLSTGRPTFSYSIAPLDSTRNNSQYQIDCNDWVLDAPVAAVDVASIVEMDLFRRSIQWAQGCVVLHAGGVLIDGSATVMVGASGSGKTTLTRAFLESGATYLSDECIAIDPAGHVWGLSRPMYFKQAPTEVDTAHFAVHHHEWEDIAKQRIRDRVLHPRRLPTSLASAPLSRLCLISHSTVGPEFSNPVSPGQALADLWPCVFNPNDDALQVLETLVAAHKVHQVQSASIQRGCALVCPGGTREEHPRY